MNSRKRTMLFGIWASLALVLLLVPAVGTAATPPPPPDWDDEEDRTANRAPALAYPPPDSTLPEGAAPNGSMAPAQTTETCPIDTNFDSMPDGWVAQAGTWYTENGNLFTTGVPDKLASITAPGRYINFSFEASMLRAGCTSCVGNRMIVRGIVNPLTSGLEWFSHYSFVYEPDGLFMATRRTPDGSHGTLISPQSSSAIKQGANWNTLRVEALNHRLSFYINNVQVWTGIDLGNMSGQVGFGMWDSSSTANDRLWVDYARLCLKGHLNYMPLMLQPAPPPGY